jgi:hypothetical protein
MKNKLLLIKAPINKNSYLYMKDAKSFFDVPREKLSARPFLGHFMLRKIGKLVQMRFATTFMVSLVV